MNKAWDALADDQTINKTIEALKQNGSASLVVENGEKAKEKILELLPKGEEVMSMSSVTLDSITISKEINESGNYDAIKPKLMKMDRKTQGTEMQKMGSAPRWTVGSVHAVTQDGKVLIASNTGSQLSAYSYASTHVIWVVGTQKIVENLDEGIKRIYEYVLPIEDEKMKKLYNVGSNVSKLLIVNKEIVPGRVMIIFVKEKLGY